MKMSSNANSGRRSVHLKYRSLVRTSQTDGFLTNVPGRASVAFEKGASCTISVVDQPPSAFVNSGSLSPQEASFKGDNDTIPLRLTTPLGTKKTAYAVLFSHQTYFSLTRI